MRGWDTLPQITHVAHILLTTHCVDDRARTEEEKGFEEGMGEDVEHTRGKCTDAEGEEHVPELRDSRVRKNALDVVLHKSDRSGKDGGESPDDCDCFHRCWSEYEDGVGAGYHVDTCLLYTS